MGQYFNDEVRAFVQGQLSQAEAHNCPLVPMTCRYREQLTQLVEGIATHIAKFACKSFWQGISGH